MSDVAPSVFQASNRAFRYWESDGLGGMVQGLLFVLVGLGGLLINSYRGSAHGFGELGGDLLRFLAMVILVEEFSLGKVTRALKSRITYPRTGYIAKPEPIPWQPDGPFLSSLDREQYRKEKAFDRWTWLPWILLVVGIFTDYRILLVVATLWLALLIWRHRRPDQVLWDQLLILLLCGSLLTFLPTHLKDRLPLSIVVLGAFSFLTGLINLFRYLRKYPAPKP